MTGSSLLHLLPLSAYLADPTAPIGSPSLADEGFVHCSPDLHTTLAVANTLHRGTDEPMVVLELDAAKLSAPIHWEAAAPSPPAGVPADVLFPHVYGPLDRTAVIGLHYARRSVSGNFLAFEARSDTAEEFDLLPHPEGGWYRRTWASGVEVSDEGRIRGAATAIYFLLPARQRSHWHTVSSDELWFWHRGAALTLTLGGQEDHPSESARIRLDSATPQAVVPAGTWQRADASADAETLVSCVVSPGFDFHDFRIL